MAHAGQRDGLRGANGLAPGAGPARRSHQEIGAIVLQRRRPRADLRTPKADYLLQLLKTNSALSQSTDISNKSISADPNSPPSIDPK